MKKYKIKIMRVPSKLEAALYDVETTIKVYNAWGNTREEAQASLLRQLDTGQAPLGKTV